MTKRWNISFRSCTDCEDIRLEKGYSKLFCAAEDKYVKQALDVQQMEFQVAQFGKQPPYPTRFAME